MEEIERLSGEEGFWSDGMQARGLMRERARLEGDLLVLEGLGGRFRDVKALWDLGDEEGDEGVKGEAREELESLSREARRREMELLFSGEADETSCYLEVHAGAGGAEAQDWAGMLFRMYMRWAEGRGYKAEALSYSDGEEAGLTSATMKVEGSKAYGWLRTETGVHRMVRLSRFDSQGKRHTCFAGVRAYPEVDDEIEVDVKEADVRVDTYRSSGAGGQHVNTTDSAVRLTHKPTGVVVQCQKERSQHKNRATAWKMLRARLYERELAARKEASAEEAASREEIGWGRQIRSYVLHPYRMVKDLRTGYESSDTDKVLGGDLDGFMEAALTLDAGSSGN